MNKAEIKQILKTYGSKYRFLSFATIGGILTLSVYGVITFCIKYLNTPLEITYIICNLIGILISFYLNSKITFRNDVNFKNTLKYYAIYLSSTLIGALLLTILEKNLSFEKWVYPFLVLPVTLLFNFFMSSKFLTTKELELLD